MSLRQNPKNVGFDSSESNEGQDPSQLDHASVYTGGDMTVKLKKIDDKPRNSIDTVLEWKVVPESTAYKGF